MSTKSFVPCEQLSPNRRHTGHPWVEIMDFLQVGLPADPSLLSSFLPSAWVRGTQVIPEVSQDLNSPEHFPTIYPPQLSLFITFSPKQQLLFAFSGSSCLCTLLPPSQIRHLINFLPHSFWQLLSPLVVVLPPPPWGQMTSSGNETIVPDKTSLLQWFYLRNRALWLWITSELKARVFEGERKYQQTHQISGKQAAGETCKWVIFNPAGGPGCLEKL